MVAHEVRLTVQKPRIECPKCHTDDYRAGPFKDGHYYCWNCNCDFGRQPDGLATISDLIASGYIRSKRTAWYKLRKYGIATITNTHRTLVPITEAQKLCPEYWAIVYVDGAIKVTTTLASELVGCTKEAVNKWVRRQVVSGFLMSGHQWTDWHALASYLTAPQSQLGGDRRRPGRQP